MKSKFLIFFQSNRVWNNTNKPHNQKDFIMSNINKNVIYNIIYNVRLQSTSTNFQNLLKCIVLFIFLHFM